MSETVLDVLMYLFETYSEQDLETEPEPDQGVLRGLIGPREVERLWERHLLNSAAVAHFLPDGTVADVGSGAGLPGLVIAAMQPEREVVLIEPMERRTTWLTEAANALELSNVRVLRGRAEEVGAEVSAQAVTARAVRGILGRLSFWVPCVAIFTYVLAEMGVIVFANYHLRTFHQAPESWAIYGPL